MSLSVRGLVSSLWSTSAAFADLDGDGDLDLYVANYLDFDAKSPPYCAAPDGRRDYCGPEDFPAQPDRLYRNNGDGTFTDVAALAGIDQPEGRGLGVLIAELTGDNRPDIYRRQRRHALLAFRQPRQPAFRGNRRRPPASPATARDRLWPAWASPSATSNGDGPVRPCRYQLLRPFNHRVRGPGATQPELPRRTSRLGLAAATRQVLGFGVALADFDGDGRLDLIQTNGHVLDRVRLGTPLAMRPTLLHKIGDGSTMSPIDGADGSTGRSWAEAWPSATSTATAGPTWSRAPSMRPPRSAQYIRRGQLLSLDVVDRTAGRPSGLACASRPAADAR